MTDCVRPFIYSTTAVVRDGDRRRRITVNIFTCAHGTWRFTKPTRRRRFMDQHTKKH